MRKVLKQLWFALDTDILSIVDQHGFKLECREVENNCWLYHDLRSGQTPYVLYNDMLPATNFGEGYRYLQHSLRDLGVTEGEQS